MIENGNESVLQGHGGGIDSRDDADDKLYAEEEADELHKKQHRQDSQKRRQRHRQPPVNPVEMKGGGYFSADYIPYI